jgi:hypothetical protein
MENKTGAKVQGSEQAGERGPWRINVDLVGEAADSLQKLLDDRQLTVSQAVRQGLSLLAEYDPREYDLVLRKKDGSAPDVRLKLIGT